MPEFLGLPCVELKNEALTLLVTQTVGPRILSLRIHGGENLFAEVPDFTLDCPGVGKHHLWGGHRFWVAPEDPRTTYLPDDEPPEITPTGRGLKVIQPMQDRTGLQKSMEVILTDPSPDSADVLVEHSLTNLGSATVTCAPWAITQFKPGGFAILSPWRIPQDRAGLRPDRQFTLWPYTDIRSPHIDWGNTDTFVHARLTSGALKLGFSQGSLAYYRARTLFLKASAGMRPPYFNSMECYCNDRFLELETVGQVVALEPGQSMKHLELWWVRDNVDLEPTEKSFMKWCELTESW